MRRVSIALMLATLLVCGTPANAAGPTVPELPRLGARYWLNSEPLTLAGLRGRSLGRSHAQHARDARLLAWLESGGSDRERTRRLDDSRTVAQEEP